MSLLLILLILLVLFGFGGIAVHALWWVALFFVLVLAIALASGQRW